MHVHYEYDPGCMPSWITLPYYMPIFCFVSGVFFREKPWHELIAAKARTLLVPFLTFYLFTLLCTNCTNCSSRFIRKPASVRSRTACSAPMPFIPIRF